MTPKEEAEELVEKFHNGVRNRFQKDYSRKTGILSALIAVGETLELLNTMRDKFNETEMFSCGNHTLGKINHLEKVKSELEKL